MHLNRSAGEADCFLLTAARARRLASTFSHHETSADLRAYARALEQQAGKANLPVRPRELRFGNQLD